MIASYASLAVLEIAFCRSRSQTLRKICRILELFWVLKWKFELYSRSWIDFQSCFCKCSNFFSVFCLRLFVGSLISLLFVVVFVLSFISTFSHILVIWVKASWANSKQSQILASQKNHASKKFLWIVKKKIFAIGNCKQISSFLNSWNFLEALIARCSGINYYRYSSNEIRKTQNEYLIINCQNLIWS